MKYSCGCVNEVDAESGVLHCVQKCEFHVKFKNEQGDGLEYYLSLGCIKDGIPQNLRYIREFKDAFEEIDAMPRLAVAVDREVLEVGCGVGMYVPMFHQLGWRYNGLETSEFAAEFTYNNHDVEVWVQPFEMLHAQEEFHGILAAHVVEHMKKAPAMLKKMYDFLTLGGTLWIIVPDDTDQTNPDHWWFFTQKTLHALLENIGFRNVRSTMRKRVEHENFIYCVAEK